MCGGEGVLQKAQDQVFYSMGERWQGAWAVKGHQKRNLRSTLTALTIWWDMGADGEGGSGNVP